MYIFGIAYIFGIVIHIIKQNSFLYFRLVKKRLCFDVKLNSIPIVLLIVIIKYGKCPKI